MEGNELAVEEPQAERQAGRPVTVGRLRAADAKINAARTPKIDTACCRVYSLKDRPLSKECERCNDPLINVVGMQQWQWPNRRC